jgi:hypothetical protein
MQHLIALFYDPLAWECLGFALTIVAPAVWMIRELR